MPNERALVRLAIDQFGQTEVEHLHVAVGAHHDVLRFDVAVGDAALVGGGQCARDLHRDAHGLAHRDGAAVEPMPQRISLDELAHDEGPRVEGAEIMDDQDVRMIERRGGPCLGVEPAQPIGVRRRRAAATASTRPDDRASYRAR